MDTATASSTVRAGKNLDVYTADAFRRELREAIGRLPAEVVADTEPKPWQPGDRVVVRLPDKSLRRGPGGSISLVDVHGTVRTVDNGGRPGVSVDLDREVNGVRSCYATHRELRPEVPDA